MTLKQRYQADWLSIYLFTEVDLNILLQDIIDPLLIEMYKGKFIQNYFFIRYWENGQHIRLRMKPADNMNKEALFDKFREVQSRIGKEVQCNDKSLKIELSEYVPEIMRYGGNHSMKIAEEQFESSSTTVLKILCKYSKKWDYSFAISMALQIHLLFMHAMRIAYNEQVVFLEYLLYSNLPYALKSNDNSETVEEIQVLFKYFERSFEQQKDKIIRICDFDRDLIILSPENWEFAWYNDNKRIIDELYDLDKNGRIEFSGKELNPNLFGMNTSKMRSWLIFNSYFHMTNNRLGIYLRDEPYLYYLLWKGIKAISMTDQSVLNNKNK